MRTPRSSTRRALTALGLAAVLLGLSSIPAAAAPSFELELTREEAEFPVVYRDDERVDYTVTVGNDAEPFDGTADVGDVLRCQTGEWLPAAANAARPAVSYEWRRDGQVIPGESGRSYTVTAPNDVGTAIQCVVRGTNFNASTKFASLNPVAIQPLTVGETPMSANPTASTGDSRPTVPQTGTAARTCTPPTNWEAPAGTAFDDPADFGFRWLRNGDPIAGAITNTYTPAIATGTATRALLATGTGDRSLLASGSATRVIGTNVLINVTGAGSFTVGESVSGAGIPEGSTITAIDVDEATITISENVATSGNVSPLVSGSKVLTNVTGSFTAGESITGTGIPNNTTITAVGAGTLTLSRGVLSAGTATALASGSRTLTAVGTTTGTFAVGDVITGTGFGPATKVTAVDTGAETITLSKGVTAAGSSTITGGADNGIVLQCEVVGTVAGGGAAVGISNNSATGNVAQPPNSLVAQTPLIGDPNATEGFVVVALELPPGLGTRVHSWTAVGWTCEPHLPSGAAPAKLVCRRTESLGPGGSYQPIVVQARLGADAPDHAVASASVSGGGAPAPGEASLAFDFAPAKGFGIEAFETAVNDQGGNSYTQAGGHPFSVGTNFLFNGKRSFGGTTLDKQFRVVESAKTVTIDAPRGFVGNALAIRELCASTLEVIDLTCPSESVVGGIDLEFNFGNGTLNSPIFAIEPEFGRPAQFAFTNSATNALYTFYPRLRPEDGYAISFESAPLPIEAPGLVRGADVTLCGFGARFSSKQFAGCKLADDADANPKPLVTLPTRCAGPPPTSVMKVNSWQNPNVVKSKSFSDPPLDPDSCENVKFEPEMELEPTSGQADSPTGMDVEIFMPTDGLESKEGISQANLKRVSVKLPRGMAVNASAGHGLLACSAAQVGMHPVTGVPNDAEVNCPEASKIGTIGITTPLIASKLTGDVYIAKQGADNPFDSNIALYMVFSSKRDGITIKVAGEVKPDPVTGQMEIVFDDNPEAPFSSVELHFPAGPRANLVNPPACGNYAIEAELSPWTEGAPVTTTSTFQVNQGPGGGPCPDGRLDPRMNAGTTSPVAGKPSPFVMRLTREDGTQRFTALDLATPRGLVASLRGIPYCPDEVLASISPAAETGQAQIDNPSCPAASLIGHASAGAGAGPNPFYVNTGRAYLAGPYKGAPLSLALVTPAVAGPIDLGNVVVRTALHVNPETAQITAISDPIPTILHGILLGIRDIRVALDRPNFTQNPTSCAEMAVNARVSGDGGGSVNVANRFQAMECASLGFAPRVNLRLVGGTKRGGHPSLRAVVRPRPGDANIRRAAVSLPRSAFLDQANIRTICTRVQWAADNCPKAAQYGFARAWSPLLDQPLQGPVYLRSSNNLLPDLVADLRGPAHQPIKIEAAFRTDSIRGGIRSTMDLAPDAPVSRFVLRMQGGKRKGLIVNSRDICRGTNRAHSRMIGHNGRRENSRPKVHAANCGKARKAAKRKGAKGKGNRQNLSNLRQDR